MNVKQDDKDGSDTVSADCTKSSNGNSISGSAIEATKSEDSSKIVDRPGDSAAENGSGNSNGDAVVVEKFNDPLSAKVAPMDVGVDAADAADARKQTIDLEAGAVTGQEPPERSLSKNPRDEETPDGKVVISVDSSENGKVKESPNASFEQEASPPKEDLTSDPTSAYGELVVARAVPCDEEIVYDDELKKLDIKQVATPAFEDYDSKDDYDRKSFCRRYAVVVGGLGALGIGLIIMLAVLLLRPKAEINDDLFPVSSAPSASPTTSRETILTNIVVQELSPEILLEGTTYSMALDWILYFDPKKIEYDPLSSRNTKFKIMQRYALAVFYFASTQGGQVPWRSCNPVTTTDFSSDNTCTFLEPSRSPDGLSIVYEQVPGKIRWLSSHDECQWQGVVCSDEGFVLQIRAEGQGIKVPLDRLLAGGVDPKENDDSDYNVLRRGLPVLKILDLSYNDLIGTIPASLTVFNDLFSLELHGNSLSGQIPVSIFDKLTSLQLLNLGENGLTGTLDTKIGQLTELRGFHLHENNLQGQIPSEIGKLTLQLTHSYMYSNEFTGPLPSEIGQLTNLVEVQFSNNLFTGEIPTYFGELTNVDVFRLDWNQFSGTIPVELCNLTNSRALMLDNNALTGPLPTTELSRLTKLIRFQVNNNQLTGEIPSQLGDMPSLRLAWLHLNQFAGAMPIEVCETTGDPNTGLSFLQADCAPFDNPPNPCRCCSACCDRSTGICLANG